MNLKSAEKMFFGQKLKCSFFKDCDRGSKFFHALMSQKHRRNFIPIIQRSNNLLTTSLEVVGEEFVNYYQQLLGSSKDMIPIDLEVIHSGSCLATSAHDLLLAPVTSAEIKKRCCLVLAMIKPLVLMGTLPSFSSNPGMLWGQILVQRFRISLSWESF